MSKHVDLEHLLSKIEALEARVCRQNKVIEDTIVAVYRIIDPHAPTVFTFEQFANVMAGLTPDGLEDVTGNECRKKCDDTHQAVIDANPPTTSEGWTEAYNKRANCKKGCPRPSLFDI
jgi:hypothetical protein